MVARLSEDGDLHAPHLVYIEVLHSLRRLVLDGELTNERADDVRTDWVDLAVRRYPHQGLAGRIWELRHNLTAYDAAFVVLAEELAVPLLTCDRRLGRAPLHRAVIEVYGEGS
ncbi:MAG: type II toxin-antitoxin system VapC family toxin [Acidimicrobiales bacterium]